MDEELRRIPLAAGVVSGPKLLLRGLLLKCPVCGSGNLFKRWFTMKPHCPSCGFYFDREPGWYIGAMTINTGASIATFAVAFAAGLWLTWPEVPWETLTIVVAAAVGVLHILFYPVAKTLWLAVDLLMHRMETGLH